MRVKLADIRIKPLQGIWDRINVGALWCEDANIFLLHNNPRKNGCVARNLHGYKYSYVYHVDKGASEFDTSRAEDFVPNRIQTKDIKSHIGLDFRRVKRFEL